MFLSSSNQLEDLVVSTLKKGPMTGPEVIEHITKQRPNTTKEVIYRVLRELRKAEVVTKTAKHFSLNRYWVQKVLEFGQTVLATENIGGIAPLSDMSDGDRIVYIFKNPFTLDITWGHMFDLLYEKSSDQPILIHHTHEWLVLARPESEEFFLSRFHTDKKILWFSISGNEELDKQFKQKFRSPQRQINTGTTYGMKNNEYLNVVDDFIITVKTSHAFADSIDTFYKQNKTFHPKDRETLAQIAQKQSKSKLTLTRNKKKADEWRKRFSRDFN